jgi:hypothetical protein
MNDAPKITFDDTHRLAVYRPSGVLDMSLAAQLLDFLLAMENAHPDPFSRLLDLTAVVEIRLSGTEMYHIAQTRRVVTDGRGPFRTAILAPTLLAYGMGRMYELLMEGSAIQIGVFRDAEGAASWLGVPRAVVEPSAEGGA